MGEITVLIAIVTRNRQRAKFSVRKRDGGGSHLAYPRVKPNMPE